MGRRTVAPERKRGQRVRILTLSATAAGVGAGIALERSHLHALADDREYQALSAPLGGDVLTVTSADGTRLHVETFGPDEGPTVLLAHGWTEQLRFWGPVIKQLRERGVRVVAYDLRGHGESERAPTRDYSLDRFGDDLEAVVAATVPDGSLATVAGHSLGAMAIAAWAQRYEVHARAQAAVMINTGLGDLIAGNLLVTGVAARLISPRVSTAVLGSRAPVPSFSSPLAHRAIRSIAFGPSATHGQVAFYERMLIECPADVRAAVGLAMSEMDLYPAVTQLTVPTLVIAGDSDRLTPPAHARRIASTLPIPAGLIVLERTGHMSPLERPEQLSNAIAQLVTHTAGAAEVATVSQPAW
jgi:pimeloyl-ACP methyl ester carboxylesterase